jgi:hypothetical protein
MNLWLSEDKENPEFYNPWNWSPIYTYSSLVSVLYVLEFYSSISEDICKIHEIFIFLQKMYNDASFHNF